MPTEKDPFEVIREAAQSAASSFAARHAAASLAALQASHFTQLRAEGLDPSIALAITTSTSAALLDAITVIVKMAPAIIDATGKAAPAVMSVIERGSKLGD